MTDLDNLCTGDIIHGKKRRWVVVGFHGTRNCANPDADTIILQSADYQRINMTITLQQLKAKQGE